MQALYQLLLPTFLLALLASVLTASLPDSYRKLGEARDFDDVLFLDLDNCLYPRSSKFQEEFFRAIPGYYVDQLGMTSEVALQKYHYYRKHFHNSLRGLYHEYEGDDRFNVDEYITYQDKNMNYDLIKPDAKLRKTLKRVKARLIIVTNSGITHAERALKNLKIHDLFEGILFSNFHDREYVSKPQPEVYETAMMIASQGRERNFLRFYFVDDDEKNIAVGKQHEWTCLLLKEGSDAADEEIGHVSHIEQIWSHLF